MFEQTRAKQKLILDKLDDAIVLTGQAVNEIESFRGLRQDGVADKLRKKIKDYQGIREEVARLL